MRKCANPYSGEFYILCSPAALYCSDTCSKRVMAQKYRKKHEDELAKYRRELQKKQSNTSLSSRENGGKIVVLCIPPTETTPCKTRKMGYLKELSICGVLC